MGSGRWSADTYAATTAHSIASGTSFAYSTNTSSTLPRSAWKAHEALDAKKVAGDKSLLAGEIVRESRDSDEHPTSIPVAVIFDVTGSMGGIPKVFISKMKELFSLVLRKGYIEHPQVLVGAVGDAYADVVPLQIGQFESDNRVDETLDKIFLEGGGGGGNHESYELAMWYMANCTVTDSFEKRGKKGYLFLVGDERAYEELPADVIEKHTGKKVQGPVPLSEIIEAVKEKWEVYFIVPAQGSYPTDVQSEWWAKAGIGPVGDRVLVLQDSNDVAELIAITIGVAEGVIDLDEGLDDLKDVGSSAGGSVSKALVKKAGGGTGGGVAVIEDAPSDLDTTTDDSERI
jgi:hypothetical protein